MPKPAISNLLHSGIGATIAVMIQMEGRKVAIKYVINTISANINFAHARVRIYIIRRRWSFITA